MKFLPSLLLSILFAVPALAAESIGDQWLARGKAAAEKLKKLSPEALKKMNGSQLCDVTLEGAFAPHSEPAANRALKHKDDMVFRLIFEGKDKKAGAWLNILYKNGDAKTPGYMVVELQKNFGVAFENNKGVAVTTPGCMFVFPIDNPLAAKAVSQ